MSIAERRRRRSRGVALVEGALVFPVVFFCFFAIIETGLFFATSSTTNNAARDGARYGASNFATSADRQIAADEIGAQVTSALGALTSYGTPRTLWIYEADPDTGEPATTDCSVRCFRYSWNGTTFVHDGVTSWATSSPNDVDACVGGSSGAGNAATGGIDSIGVRVEVAYRTVSGLVSDRTISHHTTMRIEPLPNVQCTSGS